MVYQVKDPHIIAIPYSILNPCKSFILHFHISHIDLMSFRHRYINGILHFVFSLYQIKDFCNIKRFDVGLFKSANLFKLAIKICWNAAMVGIFISEFINQSLLLIVSVKRLYDFPTKKYYVIAKNHGNPISYHIKEPFSIFTHSKISRMQI